MDKLNQVDQQEKKQTAVQKAKIFSAYRLLTACMVLTSLLCVSAFADNEVTVSSLLSDATPTVTTAMSSVWTLMTSNPISTFALGCAILTVGFRFIRRAIRVSHKA